MLYLAEKLKTPLPHRITAECNNLINNKCVIIIIFCTKVRMLSRDLETASFYLKTDCMYNIRVIHNLSNQIARQTVETWS